MHRVHTVRGVSMIMVVIIVSLVFALLSLAEGLGKQNGLGVRILFCVTCFAFVALASFLAGGFNV